MITGDSMKITVPMVLIDDGAGGTNLASSNLAEDGDNLEYDAGTTYALGDEVYVSSSYHKTYRSTQGSNTGNLPPGDDGTWWVEIGWTNRWRSLTWDSSIATVADTTSGITYALTADGTYDAVAFFGLQTTAVTVTIKNGATVVSTETKTATETVNGLSFFVGVMLFPDLTILSGYTIEIIIADSGLVAPAQVSKIVVGYTHDMGDAATGINSTFDDLSDKEQDEFGRFEVVARGFSDVIEYSFSHVSSKTRWVQSVLMWLRVTPCVYWVSEADIAKGLFIFGFASEPQTNLAYQMSTTEATVVGLALGGSVAVADVPGGGGPVNLYASKVNLISYVLASLGTDEAVDSTWVTLSWDDNIADSNWGWTAGDTVFTVPSGVNVVNVLALFGRINTGAAWTDEDTVAEMQINGTTVAVAQTDNQQVMYNRIAMVKEVTLGDEISFRYKSYSGSVTLSGTHAFTALSIEGYG